MVRYVVFAAAALMLSLTVVDMIERSGMMDTRATAAKPAPQAKVRVATSSPRMVVIPAKNGHFSADARVNGRPMNFMVDTGASVIVIRESDAATIGIRPYPADYKIPIATANGQAVAAPAELDRVEIDGIEVRDIRAIVLPDKSLSVNLLGMSFLSRVRWTHDTGKLVLEQ